MIEYFRHEAMNQTTVISGFAEIIGTGLDDEPECIRVPLSKFLQNIEQLLRVFNETLAVFRKECGEISLSGEQLSTLDPETDLTRYFSESCCIHFMTLKDISKHLVSLCTSVTINFGENLKLKTRFNFIVQSSEKLENLFTRPVGYLQKAYREE